MEEGLSEKEREHGSKGGRETSREVVYSQTNHSQTDPCPSDWVHMPWHGLDALQGTRAKPGNHLVVYNILHYFMKSVILVSIFNSQFPTSHLKEKIFTLFIGQYNPFYKI